MHAISLLSLLSLNSLAASHPGVSNDFRRAVPENVMGGYPVVSPSPSLSPMPSSSVMMTPSPMPSQLNSPMRLGRATVINRCSMPLYLWSVGSTVQPEVLVRPYGRYYETFHKDTNTGGIAIKISNQENGLYVNAPMTVFAYTLSNNTLWYDLSDVFGHPFSGYPVHLQPATPEIYWVDGIPPAGSEVRKGSASMDLVLTLC